MRPESLGRILLLDANGGPAYTVHYSDPAIIRQSTLLTIKGEFRQDHQTADGQWVYTYVGPLGSRAPDVGLLTAWHGANDPDWDGPVDVPLQMTFANVQEAFRQVLARQELVSQETIKVLYSIVLAAWPKESA